MALISFLHLMFGIAFVVRTSRIFYVRGVVSDAAVTKTGTAFLSLMSLTQFWSSELPVRAFFLDLSLAAGPLFVFLFLERRSVDGFKARVPQFFDRWILNLRLGNSVSAARDAALRDECPRFQALVAPLFSARATNLSEHVLFAPVVIRELQAICASPHSQLARLENLRESLRRASEFRRRSGQAVRQTAIQSAVMLVLLLAMSVFTVRHYGWTRSGDLVTLATALSVAGVALMLRLARKTEWKL